MFNPNPSIEAVALHDGHECLVIDNALTSPRDWRAWAVEHHEHFAPSVHAYPGIEIWLALEATPYYMEFFGRHIRNRLGARRTVQAHNRMSLLTRQPHELIARQWSCHRDDRGMLPGECMIASVIYLFEDPALGGTSFYRPRRSCEDTESLVDQAVNLDDASFARRHPEIAQGYLVDSNDWFERVATIPARWNRAIFYDGGIYHSSDTRVPERLSADPAIGRLTMNGFAVCRRKAG
jgi:hypothetical protein